MLQVKIPVDPTIDMEKRTIKAILYFTIFSYPLTRKEVMAVSGDAFSPDILDDLVERKLIGKIGSYYGVNIQEDWIEARKRDEHRFQEAYSKLLRSTRIISRFPFVEGVALSGASSKGLMKPDGDLDFFIITRPERLWICRTLLILNKKLLRLNSKRYFCVNYFVSSDNLEIRDKNRFTASEIIFLAPLYNQQLFDEFLSKNTWVNNFYQNSDARKNFHVINGRPLIKRMMERILSGRLGEWMEKWTHKRTLKRWERKFGHYNDRDFELTMRSESDVSKHHPSNFQKRVLDRYDSLLEEFEKKHGITL